MEEFIIGILIGVILTFCSILVYIFIKDFFEEFSIRNILNNKQIIWLFKYVPFCEKLYMNIFEEELSLLKGDLVAVKLNGNIYTSQEQVERGFHEELLKKYIKKYDFKLLEKDTFSELAVGNIKSEKELIIKSL